VRREDVDALLFDLGGVLVEIDFDRVCARWAELAGVPVEHVRARFSHGPDYQRHERGEIDMAAYAATLRRDLGIGLEDEPLIEGWQRVFVDAIEPTVRLVRELRGKIPMYVFSNTNATHHAFWRERYAAALEPFDRVFVSSEIGARKPEPEAYARVARAIGVPIDRILFFDDSAENVAGALAAGMRAIRVRSPDDVQRAVGHWLDVAGARTAS
jgi:putative hydrolase of the HAD superfamily